MLLVSCIIAGSMRVGAQPGLSTGSGQWQIDPLYSSVTFSVNHLGISEIEGRFKTFSGTMESPADDFSNAIIKADVDVFSLTTDCQPRDLLLRSADYFDMPRYPRLNFSGTSFTKKGPGQYALEGYLTIKDVTQKVTFAVTGGTLQKDQDGYSRAGFKATAKISRKAFHVNATGSLPGGTPIVGDEVTLTLRMEMIKAKR